MSSFGDKIKLNVFGASHAKEIGVEINGLPKGFNLDFDKILKQLERRAPGRSHVATPRKESDFPVILSGVKDMVTTGETLKMVIKNTNQHSKDYRSLKICPRPGHADYTAHIKYNGQLDMSGGGPFSGRMMAPVVFAGEICRQILFEEYGIDIVSHIKEIAGIKDKSFLDTNITHELYDRLKADSFPTIDSCAHGNMIGAIEDAMADQDSVGGIVECAVLNMKEGIGGPIFDGVESVISSAMFSIPACKGVEFGLGFESARIRGSQNNDEFTFENGKVVTKTNNCGGILGGITNGMPLLFSVAFKPTPSIAKAQNTVNLDTKENTTIEIVGRHDPCIVTRVAPIVEAMAAIAIINLL
ncbi:MAG: chorismate synthase [Ruminococcaceae bacterium]|nr:chorismate synthase [Oscillospiraceae bacterium]